MALNTLLYIYIPYYTFLLSICEIPAFFWKIASAFGGLPALPGTFSGQLVKRKEYLLSRVQVLDRASRSQSSPIFRPNKPKKSWCNTIENFVSTSAPRIYKYLARKKNSPKFSSPTSFPSFSGGICSKAIISSATVAK